MLVYFAFSTILILATTLIHAGCTAAVLGWLRSAARHHWVFRSALTRATVLAGLVFAMSLTAFVESALWAGFYWRVGELSEFQEALYFSLVTFTGLGYGDVTLGEKWRIIAALESVNGIILLGWTTAIIVAVAQRLFFHQPADASGS